MSGLPMLDEKGDVQMEEVEVSLTGFKVAYVFDVSQTSGEPLPEIGAEELLQSVNDYQIFMEALQNVAPVPVEMQEVEGEAKGYFSPVAQKIVIQSGIDGGVYENNSDETQVNVTIREALQGIWEDLKQNPDTNGAKGRITEDSELVPVNYGELEEKMEDAERIETVNTPEPEVTFTVAECGEFPTLGKCYEGIKTADEAVEIWQRVQGKNLNTVPGLGIHVHIPGQEDYMDGQIDLVSGKTIDVSILEYIPSMRKEPRVMEKVEELIHRLPDYEIIGDIQPELFVWLDVPDTMVNVSVMKEYGYQWDRMLPMGKEKALELYQKGLMVQKLYPNDTETYVQGVEDLQGNDGMFGAEKGDWEKWRSGKETQEKEIPKQESKYRTRVR